MSADDTVPDERGSGPEAAFWAVVVLVGLGAFLYDFGTILTEEVPDAEPIQILFSFKETMVLVAMLGGGATVLLVAYAIFQYGAGRRTAAMMPDVRRGQFMLGVFAIGLTFLMVTTMFVGASTLAQTDERAPDEAVEDLDYDRALHAEVQAGQWFWRADVEGTPFTQGERIVVPAQTVITMDLTSADVIHSFAIQEIGLKKDALPGQMNEAWFAIEHVHGETSIPVGNQTVPADTYQITCAELCGKGHSKMTGTLVVISPGDYEHWAEVHGGTLPESFHTDGDDGDHGGDGHDDGH